MSYGRLIYGQGLYKGIPVDGHIGAFYFGPVDEQITSSIIEISAVLLQPEVSVINNLSSTTIPNTIPVYFILLQPRVFATQDISVDFIGVPRAGSSPLTVDFTAIVNFSPENKGKYRVTEYQWCFNYDYDNNICNESWVVTTENPVSHVYTGYAGQKYSVKCCIVLESI